VSVFGSIRVSRAYYHCQHCHSGHCLRDVQLGLDAGDLTPGAKRLVSLAGTMDSFAEAADRTLEEMSGLVLSESTIQRTAERAGAELARRLAAGETFGAAQPWEWSKDAEGKSFACISADLTGVRMQGPKGAAAEGRMAAVAMVWNPGQSGQTRYVCELVGGLAALSEPLRRQAHQVGMDDAERWVAISDGGSGIEDWLQSNFPRVEAVILDFYHAAEYLNDWAKAVHPSDEAASGQMAAQWCHRLKHEGGQSVLADLRAHDVSRHSSAAREEHQKVLGYFENQVHRMDYPTYRSKGWPIGSGSVESACKQVVGQRLKCAGMRWSEAGADAICHLRALFRSEVGQWDAFWTALAV
jgi:hypothetical protein